MSDALRLDELLRAHEGDAGCNAGRPSWTSTSRSSCGAGSRERFPGTAIHLRVCPAVARITTGCSRRPGVRRYRSGAGLAVRRDARGGTHVTSDRAPRSLNVGGPREVEWEGKTVRTAIWKEPVEGPRMVRRINIDGDDQADRVAHGGEHRAVFVYQMESYRYWERELGRNDFGYGQFGENFTVEGLADAEVCIGDRYRIGDALFEVTQPRVTCYRVGIRMNEPAMPTLLVAHHRPGFYFGSSRRGPCRPAT